MKNLKPFLPFLFFCLVSGCAGMRAVNNQAPAPVELRGDERPDRTLHPYGIQAGFDASGNDLYTILVPAYDLALQITASDSLLQLKIADRGLAGFQVIENDRQVLNLPANRK